jgi:hypothetical protein
MLLTLSVLCGMSQASIYPIDVTFKTPSLELVSEGCVLLRLCRRIGVQLSSSL